MRHIEKLCLVSGIKFFAIGGMFFGSYSTDGAGRVGKWTMREPRSVLLIIEDIFWSARSNWPWY